MEIASDTGLCDSSDRIVVSCAFGTFRPALARVVTAEGEWVEDGQRIGTVESAQGSVAVVAPCSGWLLSLMASDGDRVRPGTALVHLEAC